MHYCTGKKPRIAPTTEKTSTISLLVIWACTEKFYRSPRIENLDGGNSIDSSGKGRLEKNNLWVKIIEKTLEVNDSYIDKIHNRTLRCLLIHVTSPA